MALTALALFLLDAITTVVARGSVINGLVIATGVALLTVGFWAGSARLLDRTAAATGHASDMRSCRAATARAYPVLIGFAVVDLAQAVASLAGHATVVSALGWLALPLLVCFVALTVAALIRVYAMPPFTAFALALLPYALVSAALMIVGLVLTLVVRL